MISLDDQHLGDLTDARTRCVATMLARQVYGEVQVAAVLEAAGLSPADYELGRAKLAWLAAVPDAVRQRKLDALVGLVVADDPPFGRELERELLRLTGDANHHSWYRCDDPYACGFVGSGASRAVIDRKELRSGLHDLANDEYRVLVASGAAGSGKSHSWLLIDHLRQAGRLAGHRFVRVTTHMWSDEVTGEDLAVSLADRLGLNIGLGPSGELGDARVRKVLNMIVGQYPQDDVTRWIVLDGLDRPLVQDSARDAARHLITMVSEGDLPSTRLIITGFEMSGLSDISVVRIERIPVIDAVLIRAFLVDVAAQLGREVEPEQLDDHVAEVIGTGGPPRTLREVEAAVVRLVKRYWAESGARDVQ